MGTALIVFGALMVGFAVVDVVAALPQIRSVFHQQFVQQAVLIAVAGAAVMGLGWLINILTDVRAHLSEAAQLLQRLPRPPAEPPRSSPPRRSLGEVARNFRMADLPEDR